jgi:hypothetical protein
MADVSWGCKDTYNDNPNSPERTNTNSGCKSYIACANWFEVARSSWTWSRAAQVGNTESMQRMHRARVCHRLHKLHLGERDGQVLRHEAEQWLQRTVAYCMGMLYNFHHELPSHNVLCCVRDTPPQG